MNTTRKIILWKQNVNNVDDSLIPSGDYCYELLSVSPEGRMQIKLCPYWNRLSTGYAECKFVGENDDILLDDQIKICSINLWDY